jgi:hypothetical protein
MRSCGWQVTNAALYIALSRDTHSHDYVRMRLAPSEDSESQAIGRAPRTTDQGPGTWAQ